MSLEELGAALRRAREAKGLSLRDVQAELRIRQRYLEALEEGRWQDIPGATYARGFARSYGRFLGVDVEPYLQALRQPAEEAARGVEGPPRAVEAPPVPVRLSRRLRNERRRARLTRPLRLLWLVVPVAAIWLAVALGAPHAHRHRSGLPVEPSKAVGVRPVKPSGAKEAQGRQRQQQKPAYRIVSQLANASGESWLLRVKPGATLSIAFDGRCWLSGTVDGVAVPGQIYQAGETLTYTIRRQAYFDIGLPAHSRLRIDGVRLPTSGGRPLQLSVETGSGG